MMAMESLTGSDLLEALPDPALIIDGSGVIVSGNGAVNGLLATARVPAGESILVFLPEQERSRLNPLIWLQRWAREPHSPELAHVRLWCRDRSGAQKPVRVRVGRLPTEPVTYLVLLVDVSEEQAREHRSRSAQRLAARLLAISADAIVNVDERLHIVYANASAERLFEYTAGTLTGQPLAALLPERYRADHERFMRRFAAESAPSRLMGERAEIRALTRSGTEIPLEASITKVTMADGLIFSAHLRDLRPRKAADTELARSQARFRTVFDHARQAMALIGPDGHVQEMNAAARRLLPDGVEPRGRAFASLPFWSGDQQATAAALQRAVAQAMAGSTYETRTVVRLPDGQERELDFSLSPVSADPVSADPVFAVIAEARDVTATHH
jgi:PAS domain S-box-containing protein